MGRTQAEIVHDRECRRATPLLDAAEAAGKPTTHVVRWFNKNSERREEYCTDRPAAERRRDVIVVNQLGTDVEVLRADRA
jgi:hypothetical protein